MYMRLVHLRVKPGKRGEVRECYERRVMPALAEIPGCLYATLLEGRERADDWMSATFWRSYENAEAYQQSGLPAQLLEESQDLLEHAVDWKVELQENGRVESRTAKKEIEVEGYDLSDEAPRAGADSMMYVRIVSIKVDPERIGEFYQRYKALVLPELRAQKGCRFAFLSKEIEDSHHLLSVSIWDTEQAALRYEVSGEFDKLTRKLQTTFSQDRQWKMALAPSAGGGRSSLSEPQVRGYEIVTGGRV
jgi:heme-degrading monooxygenase HmoA